MLRFTRFLAVCAAITLAVLCLAIPTFSQDTIYTYTGRPFTNFFGSPGVDTTDYVAGSLTVSVPLAPNLPLTDITALIKAADFSVTGTHHQTIPPPAAVCAATVSTDSTGKIVQWDICIYSSNYQKPYNIQVWNVNASVIGDYFFYDPNGYNQAHNTLAGTWAGNASQLPDLSITSIEPVQVVFNADVNGDGITDLVLGKPTAFIAHVALNQLGLLNATSVDIQIEFEGKTYRRTVYKAEFVPQGNRFVAALTINPPASILPTVVGVKHIFATVDPDNIIAESNESNNTYSSVVEVKQGRSLEVAYIGVSDCAPSGGCYGPLQFSSLVSTRLGADPFLLGTYPVAPANFSSDLSAEVLFGGVLSGGVTPEADMTNIWLMGKRLFHEAHKIVGIVPRSKDGKRGYFEFHGLDVTGLSVGLRGLSYPLLDSVLVAEDNFTVPAHEIGHTFRLPAGLDEEYQLDSHGNCITEGRSASGFWVQQNDPKNLPDNICFMGCRNDLFTTEGTWIDDVDFATLFKQFRTNPVDPELILFSGYFTPGGIFHPGTWYHLTNGSASSPPLTGDFAVEVLNIAGQPIVQMNFPVEFVEFLDPIGKVVTDTAPIGLAVPYPPDAFSVRLQQAGITLQEFNPHSKLLIDAIESLPDRAFSDGRTERRTALLNKAKAFEQMMASGDLRGAQNKLASDIRKHISDWLQDIGPVEALQTSKAEVLGLVDELISRLQRLQSE